MATGLIARLIARLVAVEQPSSSTTATNATSPTINPPSIASPIGTSGATGSTSQGLLTTSNTATGSSTFTSSSASISSSTPSTSQGPSTSDSSTSLVRGSTTTSPLPTTVSAKKSHQVADGTVAGAIVGVAVGIALITFLATFLFMRHRRKAAERGHSAFKSAPERPGYQANEKPKKYTAEYESYLPSSADDKAIEQRTKNTLDQIELHVENYYQNTSNTRARPNEKELASFNSPYLPESLASMLPHSRHGITLIKHTLAYLVISCISPSAKPGSSLLPSEFVGLPSSAASTESGPAAKPGKKQSLL